MSAATLVDNLFPSPFDAFDEEPEYDGETEPTLPPGVTAMRIHQECWTIPSGDPRCNMSISFPPRWVICELAKERGIATYDEMIRELSRELGEKLCPPRTNMTLACTCAPPRADAHRCAPLVQPPYVPTPAEQAGLDAVAEYHRTSADSGAKEG